MEETYKRLSFEIFKKHFNCSDFDTFDKCFVCGASNASYIANPFDEEMNGICRMQWLCTDCYNNACGDI